MCLFHGSVCEDASDPDPAYSDLRLPPSVGTARNDMGAYGGPGARYVSRRLPPTIAVQPRGQVCYAGQFASFAVQATGSEPLRYQWFFNGSPLTSSYTNVLTIMNTVLANSGTYTVFVSNLFGGVTSRPVQLIVYETHIDLRMYAGLTVTGAIGETYVVSYSSEVNSGYWIPLATNTLSNTSWLYLDMDSGNQGKRFYRATLQR